MLKLSFNNSLTSWLGLISDMDIYICKNLYVYSLVMLFGGGKCLPLQLFCLGLHGSPCIPMYMFGLPFGYFLQYDIFILFADKKKNLFNSSNFIHLDQFATS